MKTRVSRANRTKYYDLTILIILLHSKKKKKRKKERKKEEKSSQKRLQIFIPPAPSIQLLLRRYSPHARLFYNPVSPQVTFEFFRTRGCLSRLSVIKERTKQLKTRAAVYRHPPVYFRHFHRTFLP